MNLSTSLYQVSRKIPDKIALIEEDKKISYKVLWEIIERLSKAFLKIGLKEEDKVAIILPNCKEFIFSFYSLLRIKAIGVPVKDNFTCYEIEGIFNNCKPKAIITTSSFVVRAIKSK
ncbi:MAG: AMP-binding protein, partial [Nitrospinota bacterium]